MASSLCPYTMGASVLLLLCSLSGLQAMLEYQSRIPNGHKVGHPCFENTVWKGIGHQFHGGGGTINPFGEDFKKNGFEWDECLCQMDSDQDGRTNGEELGDPNCLWQPGDLPTVTDGITHPGICEPVESHECRNLNSFEVCTPMEFQCSGLDEPDTEELDLRFSEVVIPAEETTYYCTYVKFDETRDLQAFAMEPIVINEALVHHIDMYECPYSEVDKVGQPPQLCDQMGGCGGGMLAAWAVGINGLCMNDNVGIRVGKYGAKVASLRIHYHNPFHRENETDSSGLKFHLTSNTNRNDAKVLNIGQMYLEIPPGQTEFFAEAKCSDLCTQDWEHDVYLVFGAMHMHYLGTGGYSEIWRNGQKLQDIMYQDFYDYNAPHIENFPQPIHVKPGDTIKHYCRFHSRNRKGITWRGQAATDEMCHAYFVYYPAQNLSSCFNNGALETCNYKDRSKETFWDKVCDRDDFLRVYNGYMEDALTAACDVDGLVCKENCNETLQWAFANHTCLDEDKRSAIFKSHGEFARMQSSCKYYPPVVPIPEATDDPKPDLCVFVGERNAASTLQWYSALITFMLDLVIAMV